MPQRSFDDAALRSAMRAFVAAADALDEASSSGADARTVLDLAEAKAMAGLALRKRLVDLGWTAPEVSQRSAT